MCIALDLEYFYRFVRGARCKSPAVVVQAGIVLKSEGQVSRIRSRSSACVTSETRMLRDRSGKTYNHVIMAGVRDHLRLEPRVDGLVRQHA